MQRLIDWNADVLLKLLKQIVARREADGKAGWDEEPEIEIKDCVFDEVTDVIDLPKFDVNAAKGMKLIDVDPQVARQLKEYVTAIASAYHANPFHCLQHASHVAMAVTKLISRIAVSDYEGVLPKDPSGHDEVAELIATHLHNYTYGITSDPLTQFSVVLSALIHAVDHKGISNADLAKEESDALAQYKGRSVTEQRSVDKAWKKLMEPEFENLRRCIYADKSEKQRFRQVLVNAVLATDIEDEELQAARMAKWDQTFGPTASEMTELDINRKATIVIECLMQSSDIFHTMQHWHVYLKWNERLFDEMNTAFKKGRVTENPVKVWYKYELSFFDNYVIPLAMALKDIDVFVVCSDEYLNYALKNRQRWAAQGKEIVEAFDAKYNGGKEGASAAKISIAKAMVAEFHPPSETEALPRHVQRLVDWNIEALQRLLKQIVAKRVAAGKSSSGGNLVYKSEDGKIVIDEVAEIIAFPEFDAATSADKLDAKSVTLGEDVTSQLREYVTTVSTKFRDNPFHCLDHGSQVSMTANKLVSRIVAPANVESSGDSASDLHNRTFGLASDPLAQFAVVFASLIHDIDHSGVPNSQLVRESSELSSKYKNRSIAEQHSVDLAWGLLMEPGYEALRGCIYADEVELKRFRQIVVNSILSTDIIDKSLVSFSQARWEKSFGEGKENSSKEDLDRKATTIISLLMHAADSFHAMVRISSSFETCNVTPES